MSELLTNLNPPQIEAVTLPDEHALVLAGAGSGKTKVLTTRIAWLLQNAGVSPWNILAVTFTNKAARQMQTRIADLLPISLKGMWIGTFHGLCNRLLRAHWQDAGLAQAFQVLDMADQLSAIKRLLKGLNVADSRYLPKNVQQFINRNKEAGLRPHGVPCADKFDERFIELYQAYEAQCQRESVVDFSELLLRAFELLERNEPIRQYYQQRFRHILVDEFQDTNVLQYRWLKLLASNAQPGGAALFCVGDDDQSIYRFRGAEVGNMRDFESEFQVKHLIRLEQNYRSQANILDVANAIITHNGSRLGKNLWTETGAGELVRVFEADTDINEARWIVDEIASLIREDIARNDIAVLYRANAQSRVIEHQLFSNGISYRVYGGLRFFERQEIKHALAYLHLIINPGDDTAFMRVVNFPARGIGSRSVETLIDVAHANDTSLYAAASGLSGKAVAKFAPFLKLIETLRNETRDLALPDLVAHVVAESGLVKCYEADKDGQERLDNLAELENAAINFSTEANVAPEELSASHTLLAQFLSHASLEAGDHQANTDADAVQLMTVHSAKGLEFDAVFVCGLEDGLFPHFNSAGDPVALEEERRLMYVAVTRARKRLYFSMAQMRMMNGETTIRMPSPFIDEAPPDLLKWLSPGRAKRRVISQVASSGFPGARAGVSRRPATGSQSLPNGFRIGQNVRHQRFGTGVIVDVEGNESDAKVQINFGDSGVKWLLVSLAKLEAV